MLFHHTQLGRGARRGGALLGGVLVVASALVGCTIGGTGSTTATPTSTATTAPTASATSAATPTPGMPTLRYQILTLAGNSTLQGVPSVALPLSSGTNFHWIPSSTFQGLTCTAKSTADPGGPAGHTVYQVFLCELIAGHTSGTGSFLFTQVGSNTPQKIALVEVDSRAAQGQGTPLLSYTITTSQFGGAAGLALSVSSGTNYEWTPATDFQGLTCQSGGNADPGGPPGHPFYQAFACQLAAGQSTGQGTLLFIAQHMNPPAQATYTAQVKLVLGQ